MDKTEKINLEFLKKTKKVLKTGDVFVFKLKSMECYYWGIIANSKAKLFSSSNLIHVQLFNISTKGCDSLPEDFHKYALLTPPLLTNRKAWLLGYFQTITNIDIEKIPTIKQALFCHPISLKLYNDENEEQCGYYSLETVGKFAVISYLNIDNYISSALNIPLAIKPKNEWNPYWYKIEIEKKYPQIISIL